MAQDPQAIIGLNLLVGSGNLTRGNGRDSDYLDGGLYLDSRMEVSGEVTFWSADLQTTFSGYSGYSWHLKPMVGWQHYQEQLKLTNGRWTTIRGLPASQPLYGLDSRYDLNWDGLRLGLRGESISSKSRNPGYTKWD